MAKFKATQQQIQHLIATAANASIPAGLGTLHYDDGEQFSAADFDGVSEVDYVQGRMVKLYPRRIDGDTFEIGEPRFAIGCIERTYQSWGGTYPTAADLLRAAGLEVIV